MSRLGITTLIVLLGIVAAAHAGPGDPDRWLKVESWSGTVRFEHLGSQMRKGGQKDWNEIGTVSFTVRKGMPSHNEQASGDGLWTLTIHNVATNYGRVFREDGSVTDKPIHVFLYIDVEKGTYAVNLPDSGIDVMYTGATTSYHQRQNIGGWGSGASVHGKLPSSGLVLSGTETWDFYAKPRARWTIQPTEKLKAIPGGPYAVQRGDRVELDGSASKGLITSYTWTLTPLTCPVAAREARLGGARVSATLLCRVKATLEVSDGKNRDRASVEVSVQPRIWKTVIAPAAEGTLPDAPTQQGIRLGGPPLLKLGGDGSVVGARDVLVGGENDCALDTPAVNVADHTLHPPSSSGSWDGAGYVLAQVKDEGPFKDVWYVSEYKLRVARVLLLNKYLLPGGPPPLKGYASFYDTNHKAGLPVDSYLTAIRAHEGVVSATGVLGHEGLIEKTLLQVDPAGPAEPMADNDRAALAKKLDQRIAQTEMTLCEKSADPLPEIWRGELLFPLDDGTGYTKITTAVGGSRYGTKHCGK